MMGTTTLGPSASQIAGLPNHSFLTQGLPPDLISGSSRRPESLKHSPPSESDSLARPGLRSLPGLSPASSSPPSWSSLHLPCTQTTPRSTFTSVPHWRAFPPSVSAGKPGVPAAEAGTDRSRAQRAAQCGGPRSASPGQDQAKACCLLQEGQTPPGSRGALWQPKAQAVSLWSFLCF